MAAVITIPALIGSVRTTRPDAADIERAVRRYARNLGASDSDAQAAVNTALRAAGDELAAIRAGRRRADQLHHRARERAVPTPA